MTHDEHRLMVFMFTRQTIMIRTLVAILQRDSIIREDDYAAFESLIVEHEKIERSNFLVALDQYQSFAKELGILDQLPH
jgi:hypothetical protein